jgi:hypothetical protein
MVAEVTAGGFVERCDVKMFNGKIFAEVTHWLASFWLVQNPSAQ